MMKTRFEITLVSLDLGIGLKLGPCLKRFIAVHLYRHGQGLLSGWSGDVSENQHFKDT